MIVVWAPPRSARPRERDLVLAVVVCGLCGVSSRLGVGAFVIVVVTRCEAMFLTDANVLSCCAVCIRLVTWPSGTFPLPRPSVLSKTTHSCIIFLPRITFGSSTVFFCCCTVVSIALKPRSHAALPHFFFRFFLRELFWSLAHRVCVAVLPTVLDESLPGHEKTRCFV